MGNTFNILSCGETLAISDIILWAGDFGRFRSGKIERSTNMHS